MHLWVKSFRNFYYRYTNCRNIVSVWHVILFMPLLCARFIPSYLRKNKQTIIYIYVLQHPNNIIRICMFLKCIELLKLKLYPQTLSSVMTTIRDITTAFSLSLFASVIHWIANSWTVTHFYDSCIQLLVILELYNK